MSLILLWCGTFLLSLYSAPLTAQDCFEAPVITAARAITAEDIHLEWHIDDPDVSCNTTLDDITIFYRTSTESRTITVDSYQRSRVVQGHPCTTHVFYIEANYDENVVTRSQEENVTLHEVPPVGNLIWESISFDKLLLTWWHVPSSCSILYYEIRYKLRERDQCEIVEDGKELIVTTPNASKVLTNLEAYSTYEIQVAPVSEESGLLIWENVAVQPIHAHTGESAPTKPPTNLAADNNTSGQLIFTWEEPPCGDRNGIITGYEYSFWKVSSENSTRNWTFVNSDFTTDTTVPFDGLTDYDYYRLLIGANTTSGTGPLETIDARTKEGVPAAPSGVRTEVHFNTITLRWNKLTHVPGVISAYYIYHKNPKDDFECYIRIPCDDDISLPCEITRFKLEGLSGRTEYTLKISAETGGGMGNWSKEIPTTTGIPVYAVVILSLLLVMCALIPVVIYGVVISRRRNMLTHSKSSKNLVSSDGQSVTNSEPSTPSRNTYYLRNYQIYSGLPGELPWNRFKLGDELANGRYGKAYMATLNTVENQRAVCKRLTYKANADKDEVCRQMSRLCQLEQHAHVLRIMGFCQKKGYLYVLTDYANQGNLYAYVHRDRPYGIPEMFKLRVSVAVAHGMQHLASQHVIHGDLCLRRILLVDNGQEWVPKITGYGMNEHQNDFQTTDGLAGATREGLWPVHQCPPERMEKNIVDTKGDIWAFGVLVWEFFTESTAPGRLRTGRVEECPNTIDARLYNIMKHCWLTDARRRPQFFDLADALTAFIVPEDIENPYDVLDPRADRRSRSNRGSSNASQPRVSITNAEVPSHSRSFSRRGTGSSVAYYSSVPREEEEEDDCNQREEAHQAEEIETRYSSRMDSIITGLRPTSSLILTIQEEDEEDGSEEDTETKI